MLGGGSPTPPANYRAGSYSFIITNPTLAGEHMLLIPKVSILSEQTLIIFLLFIMAIIFRNISSFNF